MSVKQIKSFIRRATKRWQDPLPLRVCIASGIKGFITISLLSALGYFSGTPLIMAPFAASCITVFTTPEDEFAQPVNIIFGYFLATLIGLFIAHFLPHEWWVLGPALALTITAMAFFRVTHPPAGSVPLVLFLYRDTTEWSFLLFPALAGSFLIVIIAMVLHRIPKAREYPRPLE